MIRLLIRWALVALCVWLVSQVPQGRRILEWIWDWFRSFDLVGQVMLVVAALLIMILPWAIRRLRMLVLDMYE